ncbi:MAG: DUF1772 domain-containing protein [Myxococcales bacterium]|nr:MAG: DUF1772 domain-containing protein [Myxococcales bacterium]
MISRIFSALHLSAALGSGLIAGVFFAFSSFVMPALARLPPAQGVSAMQSINVAVLNRSFLGVFVGTAACCVVLAVRAVASPSTASARLALAGSLFYLLGCVLVTRAGNIPYNDALARLLPNTEQAADFWERYVARWSLWNHVRGLAAFVACALFILSLGGCSRFGVCATPERSQLDPLPSKLSQTGYGTAEAREFKPRFELWSDGAQKRRWIALPEGARIDSTDVDEWSFPVGTRLWKEFVVDGVRVETRLLQRVGPGSEDWAAQAYVWLPDGSDAVATPGGANDARGTSHDVPAAGQCWACHGGRKSFVLGFSALQLEGPAAPGLVNLDALVAEQRLTRAPSSPLQVPGDATAQAALGYLHGNCAHCHNQRRPAAAANRCFDPRNELDFALRSAELATVEGTATYRSAVGTAFEPGVPDASRLVELMSSRGFSQQMPPLGTEQVDAAAVGAVRGWIAALH